ncbi:MAG: gluconokinase [Conchiformibius sp.]|nr:gluconokinase [Conchiformibius sp.]
MTKHFVLMGICGCGKSTAARSLQQYLDCPFAEGDDFHPQANRDKMAGGTPLNDDDRRPWLESLRDWMAQQNGGYTVIACSALKKSYRDILRQAGDVFFIHLSPPLDANRARVAARQGHYMKANMIDSQLADLQPLEADENGIVIAHGGSPEEVWEQIRTQLPVK